MEIEEKRGPGRPRKPDALPVKLLKNYFPKAGGKMMKDAEVELPADEARDVVARGIALRNDQF